MRRPFLPALISATLLAGPALSGPALAADPGTMQERDTLRDAVTAPLEDLNLKHKDIPAVLTRAVTDPYDVTGLTRCEPIAAEIGRLDAALGPDLDEAPPPDERSRGAKVAQGAWKAGVAEVRDKTTHVLPFRGWIRKLTGAARHDKAVQAAIRSGGIRRGYLKGVGMRMNCAPPAAPSWFVLAPPPKPPPAEPAQRALASIFTLWNDFLAWIRELIG
ncbi:hypothetical protein [Caulobacter sp.]|uniref:hypothetical protein n=1 Tax=Caulobacter sp. TaxID=78 RepID=UPI003BAD4237